jgi:hypothetical protein
MLPLTAPLCRNRNRHPAVVQYPFRMAEQHLGQLLERLLPLPK